MTLTIHASSAAITRTLEAIAANLGGGLACCSLHHEGDAIILRRGDTVLHSMATPARPAAIARMLTPSRHFPGLLSGWQFDTTARQLIREGVAHALTEKEALLLAQLLHAYPASCSRDSLLKDVWGMQADIETHTLETHIYRLRHKLAELTPKPCDIVTVDSAYQLTMEPAQ